MGLFDSFRKPKQLLLDMGKLQEWPQQLVVYREIDREIRNFLRQLENKIEEVRRASDALIDDQKIDQVPERSRHIVEQHAKVLDERTRNLVENLGFTTDPFTIQERIVATIEAFTDYKEKSMKNNAALQEHFGDAIQALTDALQELDDLIINTGSQLEKLDYSTILSVRDTIGQLQEERKKRMKYEKTLNNYLGERDHNQEKQEKHRAKIEGQRKLVRDAKTTEALKEIKRLELEHERMKERYARIIFDTKHYLLKQKLTLSEQSRTLFDRLKKDPGHTIIKDHEKLSKEFEQLAEQLGELEGQDKKQVVKRLTEAAKQVGKDAHRLTKDEPILRDLKRQVMKDIAALNIYEQEQFLARARQEASEIKEKVDFITEELEGVKDEELLEQVEDLVRPFEPVIKRVREE